MLRQLYEFGEAAVNIADDSLKPSKLFRHKKTKGIASQANDSIFYFKAVVTNQATPDEVKMISRALEKQYAIFVSACVSLMPFHRIESDDTASIESYLRTFHQNIGISSSTDVSQLMAIAESVKGMNISDEEEEIGRRYIYDIYQKSLAENASFVDYALKEALPLNEQFKSGSHLTPYQKVLLERMYKLNEAAPGQIVNNNDVKFADSNFTGNTYANRMEGTVLGDINAKEMHVRGAGTGGMSIKKVNDFNVKDTSNKTINQNTTNNINLSGSDAGKFLNSEHKTFDRDVFTNMDMKKANDDIPTIVKANVGFIVGEQERVITQDVLIGIKVWITRYDSELLMEEIKQSVLGKRKFLKFVKFITGEEKSLADLVFGISKIKYDAKRAKSMGVRDNTLTMIKRRSRWAGLRIPFIMKSYNPNVSMVVTMNEVDHLKNYYGIDILMSDALPKIMKDQFLLTFVILDQSNEQAYVCYEGHGYQFQEVPYSFYERESNESDAMMRKLYRDFSGRR
jgi:hypothetical protein